MLYSKRLTYLEETCRNLFIPGRYPLPIIPSTICRFTFIYENEYMKIHIFELRKEE